MATTGPAPKRHTGGLVVVIVLGVLFFVLLSLLVFSGKSRRDRLAASRAETLTVLPPSIRLRTEPNARAPVVATATAGEQLIKVEDRSSWVRVQDSDGLVGWAECGSLERTAERERRLARYAAIRKLPPLHGVATERTALYSGPGMFSPIVGELAQGAKVQVFTRDHDYYAIGLSDGIGYADIDAVNAIASDGPELAVTAQSPDIEPPYVAPALRQDALPPPEPQPVAPPPPAGERDESAVYASVPPGGTPPTFVARVLPRYPPAARAAGVSGRVVVRGIVRRDGTIDDIEIIRDLPFGLGESARTAVSHWHFHPATLNGEPIDVYYTVTVNFGM